MENNVIFILTEGDHDSAFIYRILKANGFSSYSKIIGDFPTPLNKFLQIDVKNISIPEVHLNVAKSRFFPSEVLSKGSNLILIYSIGGESKSSLRISLVKALSAFNSQDPDALQGAPNMNMSVLYFFDADNVGVAYRIKQVEEELEGIFHDKECRLSNMNLANISEINFGVHVFTEPNKDQGMLEDIIIPLMKKDNDEIFDAAMSFLSIHNNTRLFKNKLTYGQNTSVIKKVNGQKYAIKKSLIGTVGQLQKSGKSNTICIREADYLDEHKITTSSTCTNIFEFISKATK